MRVLQFIFILVFTAASLSTGNAEPAPEQPEGHGVHPLRCHPQNVEPATEQPAPQLPDQPAVEVAFVLDSTGSMGGLIEGAKEKIWSIANNIIAREPKPQVRLGLLAYRDRGDEYITRLHDLTSDIDKVFANLNKIQAGGGGDTPESVNQALHEAVTMMSWSKNKNTARIIFLVGDAPPHMDYADDVKYQSSCKLAVEAGIVIHTVQCGSMAATSPFWQDIAKLAEGTFIQLSQTGGMVAIATPQDAEIAKLAAEIAATTIAYGDHLQQAAVTNKQATAVAAPPSVAAARASYNWRDRGRAVQGLGDLVADLAEETVTLDEIKEEQLPAALQAMPAPERLAFIQQQQEKRAALNTQLGELVRQRDAFIQSEKERLAKQGKADAFDLKVAEVIAEQLD